MLSSLIKYFYSKKYFFTYSVVEIDHCYHAVPFIFSEIDILIFPFIFVNLLIFALLVETSKYTIRGSLYIRLPLIVYLHIKQNFFQESTFLVFHLNYI